MGDCDYSYGSAVNAQTSVGHDSYPTSTITSIQTSLETSTETSVDSLFYSSNHNSSESDTNRSGDGLQLDTSADNTAIRVQNEELPTNNCNEDTTDWSQTDSIAIQDNTSQMDLSKMQTLDEVSRKLSQSKADTDTNDTTITAIDSHMKSTINGSAVTVINGNVSTNGISSDSNVINDSSVISSANTSEQQFWSTNCVTESDGLSQQTFTSGNAVVTALNGGQQFSPQFSPTMNSAYNTTVSSAISSQQSIASSAQRRAITGAHNLTTSCASNRPQAQPQTSSLLKNYNNNSSTNWPTHTGQATVTSWCTPQAQTSPNSVNPWGSLNINCQKRSAVASVPNVSPISPMKKSPPALNQTAPSMMISPSKYRRSTSMPLAKPFTSANTPFDLASIGSDNTSSSSESANIRDTSVGLPFQERQLSSGMGSANSPLDTLRFPLEQQLLEIIRTTSDSQDMNKGLSNYNHSGFQSMSQLQGPSYSSFDDFSGNKKYFRARNFGRRRGKSPFFTGVDSDNHILMDSNAVPGDNGERFSRKVFVGGLPPDIDEEEITASFRRFGPLVVDWPHKAESKSYFPPKGYAFLLFQDESSVQALIDACIQEDDKLYLCVSSPTIKDKPVQIRPWRLSDADFVLDASMPLDPRKTVFVGGVPRPLKAVELAMIMDRLYGGVCYAGIDTDPELRYPKGAGRVAFSNQQSYIAAISARFVQLQHGDIEKRVEVKPYVLDDQICDECQGARCGGKFAPFFCANVTCLQYYCEHCWATIHSRPGREFHKPLVKEGADRPRAVPFRWC
ncbi:cytoplasmic polyadenylation element-binding protein 2-like isoform X2 [Oppia nitens]|uniref:cytoplasmic polyadenylation element-binding protein 2-like isoform X2 n=1 Tax=Oppia nitens TaxID=1686743 RepID=UPI0023DB887E|nr:cytoplasmic polyadenylation element-binding protein 2-like isoform X2 [Oppia nitens]